MTDQTDALVALLGKRFITRTDVKALQRADGAYRPVHEKWRVKDLKDHLSGERSYGHYLLSQESQCKLLAYDLDLDKEARERWASDPDSRAGLTKQLRGLAEGIASRAGRLAQCPTAISFSGGKGLHVYVFTGLIDAADAKSCALFVLESFAAVMEPYRGEVFWRHKDADLYPDVSIEVFPKQEKIEEDGLGNLMRLPLGVNAKTGESAFFVDTSAPLEVLEALDPVVALSGEGV